MTVTFPEDYSAAHLAGKEAVFDVVVKSVSKPTDLELDDELAKKLGIESIERLRTVVREQIESQYGIATRQKVKRQLLDALDSDYSFELPEKLVEAEFGNIWNQVTSELEQNGKSFEDEDTTEEKAREEYRRLAERRVRLGLVLSEIGEKAGVQITDEELQRAVFEQVRRYPGQEQQIYEFFRSNPEAVASLRAPIYEEKVVDHLLNEVEVTDKTVSKEELMKDEGEDDGPHRLSPNARTIGRGRPSAGLFRWSGRPDRRRGLLVHRVAGREAHIPCIDAGPSPIYGEDSRLTIRKGALPSARHTRS